MEYVSIDIETTGLDPERHQILECCMALDDLTKPFRPQILYFRVRHDEIIGHPIALKMNTRLINSMSDGMCIRDEDVKKLIRNFWPKGKMNVAGKNVAFDLAFLKKYGFGTDFQYRRRLLDPAILYMRQDDEHLPDLAECCKRAGIELFDRQLHDAQNDALLVCQLLRRHYERTADKVD
jgi:DNA polymerase III epsilon subunit-like protein